MHMLVYRLDYPRHRHEARKPTVFSRPHRTRRDKADDVIQGHTSSNNGSTQGNTTTVHVSVHDVRRRPPEPPQQARVPRQSRLFPRRWSKAPEAEVPAGVAVPPLNPFAAYVLPRALRVHLGEAMMVKVNRIEAHRAIFSTYLLVCQAC